LKEPLALTGYVFSEKFASSHKDAIERFLTVVQKANDILLQSDAEWEALRPLMQAEDQATFLAYRDRTREGVPRRTIPAEEADARMLFRTLADIAGPALLGSVKEIPAGMYYHRSSPGG
jgi:NitT/TauT family transport system substrate-binding protein